MKTTQYSPYMLWKMVFRNVKYMYSVVNGLKHDIFYVDDNMYSVFLCHHNYLIMSTKSTHAIYHLPWKKYYQYDGGELVLVICDDVCFLTKACKVSISTCRECHCFLASASSARASLRAAPPRLTWAHAASSWIQWGGSDIKGPPRTQAQPPQRPSQPNTPTKTDTTSHILSSYH